MRISLLGAGWVMLVMSLSGCQGVTPSAGGGGPWYSDIPVGSTLELQQPVTVGPGRASVGLRRTGRDAAAGEYAANCKLELFDLTTETTVVEPDSFEVTRVTGGFTSILASRQQPVRVASAGGFMPRLARGGGDDGSSFLKTYARLSLQSPRQPNVYRVECSYIGDPWDVEALTLEEVRQGLGPGVELRLAAP